MSVTKGVDVLAAKGKRACVECVRYIGKLSEISKKCFKKIKLTPKYNLSFCTQQKFGDCIA